MVVQAKRGDFVQIRKVVLEPPERAAQVPEDTKKVPLELRVKGFLENELASEGEEVSITTVIGRRVAGKLWAVNPKYTHDFAGPQAELLTVGNELRLMLRGKSDANG